jgi:cytochrome c553
MKKQLQFIMLGIPAALLLAGCNQPAVSFAKDVKPILEQNCVECHVNNGKGTVASGFVVDSYESLMKGTKFGPVVVAGDPLSSSLYRLVSGEVDKSIQMPHNKEPLSADKIAKIEQWIAQGAKNN